MEWHGVVARGKRLPYNISVRLYKYLRDSVEAGRKLYVDPLQIFDSIHQGIRRPSCSRPLLCLQPPLPILLTLGNDKDLGNSTTQSVRLVLPLADTYEYTSSAFVPCILRLCVKGKLFLPIAIPVCIIC